VNRPIRLLAALLAVLALASPARAAWLADSTETDAWRLANGLEVRTRHVPGAGGIAVTLAFRAGSGYDPSGREGLGELVAELAFTGPAAGVPERTRAEMASLRPLGWELRNGIRFVRFTEVATAEQLPGVLQQGAARLGGVTVNDALLRTALATVREQSGQRWFGDAGRALYWRGEALAQGWNDERILRQARLPGLDRVSAREAQALVRAFHNPGNATLALAGDLTGLDVRALVEATFGRVAGGAAMPDTVQMRFSHTRRAMHWSGLEQPLAVVVAQAPAVTDSLHPAFYLSMAVTSGNLSANWGRPRKPLSSRLQWSLFDEPEIVRFYPPVAATASDPEYAQGAVTEQLQVVGGTIASAEQYDLVRRNVAWLLGGELPPNLRRGFATNPGALGELSRGMATRALWLGDAFWADYLARFETMRYSHERFYDELAEPAHQSVLVLTP
jgi:hypothetical protein